MNFQEQILRVLETGQFRRLGSNQVLQTQSRVIAATNANLKALVDESTFRADLLDRLAFAVISVPPLRERQEDIIPLALHFAQAMWLEMDVNESVEVSPEVVDQLLSYSWPGNIRELRNVVQRAAFYQPGRPITNIDLHPFPWPDSPSAQPESHQEVNSPPPAVTSSRDADTQDDSLSLDQALETVTLRYLKRALQATGYHQRKAAEWLGISYNQFRGLYRKHRSSLKAESN